MSDFSLPHDPNTGFLNGDTQNPIDIAAAIASLQAIERSSADLVALLRGSASQQQAQLDQLNQSSEHSNQMAERQAQAEQRQQQRVERAARSQRNRLDGLPRGADGRFLPNMGGNAATRLASPMRGDDGRVRGAPDLAQVAPVDPNIGMYQEFKSGFDALTGLFGGAKIPSIFGNRAPKQTELATAIQRQNEVSQGTNDRVGALIESIQRSNLFRMARVVLAVSRYFGNRAAEAATRRYRRRVVELLEFIARRPIGGAGNSGGSGGGSGSPNNDPAPAETREQRRERVRRQWQERQRRNARSRTRFGRMQNRLGDLATRAGGLASRHEGKLAKIPMIGAAITGLMAASDFKDATNANERGKAMGEGLGGMAGTALGGVGGALLGPVGAMAGAALGNAVGSWAGGTIGEVVGPYVEDWTDTLKKANLPKTMTDIWGGGVKPFFKGLGASLMGLKDAIVNAASDGVTAGKSLYDRAVNAASDVVGSVLGGDKVSGGEVAPQSSGKKADEKQKWVYEAFKATGMRDEAAKAMTAEIGRENNYGDSAMFGRHQDASGNDTNMGMVSWQGARRDKLVKYMTEQGMMDEKGNFKATKESVFAQARFAKMEIDSGQYEPTRKALLDPNISAENLAPILGKNYQRAP